MAQESDSMPVNRRATPECEDFGGKYQDANPISRYLLDNYFRVVAKLVGRIEKSAALKTLEVGCGEGHSTKRLKSILPATSKLEASEYVARQVEIASRLNPEIKVTQEDVYSLKRQDDSFDLVFLLEVLEHLDFPEKALTEIKRVSKRYLILGVPREPIWRALNMARGKYWRSFGNTPGHLNHWSSSGIVRIVSAQFGPVIAVEKPLPWTIVLAERRNQE